jgi:hypothetical protein
MIVLVALLSVAAFLVAFSLSGIVRVALSAVEIARDAVGMMRDDALDDDAREAAVQAASLRLLGVFLSLAVRSVLVLLISVAPIWGAEQAGIAQSVDVIGLLSRWDVILGSTIAICALYMLKVRLWRQG